MKNPILILNVSGRAILFLFLFLLSLAACSPWSSETNKALKMAGDNRAELEKVLNYYHKENPNPQKLKAAEFLISNMVYKYSLFGPGVDSLNMSYEYVYGVYRGQRNHVFLSDSIARKRNAHTDAEFDLKRVTSSFLINQIELAFETYNRHEWSRLYPFEVFCEYILPYKIGHSDTVCWRSYAYNKYGELLDYSAFIGADSHFEAEMHCLIESLKVKVEGASENYTRRISNDDLLMFNMDFDVRTDGSQLFKLYYVNGHTTAANIRIMIDSIFIGDFVFPSTGSWQRVENEVPPVEFTAQLDSGTHTLKMISLDKDILLDYVTIPDYIYMKFPESVISEGKYFFSNSFGRLTIAADSLINENSINIAPNPSKEWPIRIVAKDDNLYQLLFEASGVTKAIDAFPFGESEWLITYNDHGFQNQQWAFIPMENGGYQIRNKETGRVLAFSETDSILIQLPAEMMRDDYIWHIEKVAGSGDKTIDISVRAAQKISEITNRFHWSGSYAGFGPVSPIKILDYTYGSCVEQTAFQTMVLRSMGVACATDFVFNYPERDAGHSWSVIFDLDGNTVQNNCHNPVGAGTWVDAFAKGKVYRETYSINRNSLFVINNGEERIPDQFRNPYFKDVTAEYCDVVDVEVDIHYDVQDGNKFGYLMVFNNRGWVVTTWGERTRNNKVKFKDLEPRGMYLPAFFVNGRFEAFHEPFYFDSLGMINHIQTSKDEVQDMILRRKFPNRLVDESYHQLIVGGQFQGANIPDFSDANTIGIITQDMTEPIFHTIDNEPSSTFKYLRYIGPDGGHCNINAIVFYDGNGEPIEGEIIGTDGSLNNSGRTKHMAFDGDVLTYFDAPEPSGGWVGLELSEAKSVSKIRFATRNDGNMVEVGDEYELFYWFNREWASMGRRIADSNELVYESVPMGSLYWLRNHTKGWEERIFTLDTNNHQTWW
ncbi:hypothetical protein [Alkalitalea saponilacus]|uniref:Ricin B lectin domain-containing protein n=1 Tax=Alkalitalea saponilacus TaxID=889453 RepID=A0A1T5EY85_9BACT|nr:hypothetical protein [Alkalitalea saponilacus]ASB47970.1 hypothetical protein CDL62_01780 [Alkalitalea saponilacus]SKB88902.1 hypothetical protein SAMN03080601_01459 [Alkalitalea saponilacus]